MHGPSGLGKIILAGEYAVLHGKLGLACAIPRGTVVHLRKSQTWQMSSQMLGVDRELDISDPSSLPDLALLAMFRSFQELLGPMPPYLLPGKPGLRCTITGDLPIGQGLGSSAALCAATARSLLRHREAGRRLSSGAGEPSPLTRFEDDLVLQVAQVGERYFHSQASGIDLAASMLKPGELISFRRAAGQGEAEAEVASISPQKQFDCVVLCTGKERATASMVTQVQEGAGRKIDGAVERLFDQIGTLTQQALGCLVGGDVSLLGRLMNRNHQLLGVLGVSTPELDDLCDRARKFGALGAKLTGAGGGGAVVAVARRGDGDHLLKKVMPDCKQSFCFVVGQVENGRKKKERA